MMTPDHSLHRPDTPLLAHTADELKFGRLFNAALQGDERGILYEYMYLNPRRAPQPDPVPLGEAMARSPHHHVFHDGIWMLKNYNQEWARRVGAGKPYTEAGVGSGTALNKPKINIQAFTPSHVIVNDQSEAYASEAENNLRLWADEHGVAASVSRMTCSWMDAAQDWSVSRGGALFLQGNTFTNFEAATRTQILRQFANIVGTGGHIFVDFCTRVGGADNLRFLQHSYGSDALVQRRKRILEYAKDVFALDSLTPQNWRWHLEQGPEKGLHYHTLVADRPQSFTLLGVEHRNVDRLVISHRRSLDPDEFNEAAAAAGTDVTGTYPGRQGMVFKSLAPACAL